MPQAGADVEGLDHVGQTALMVAVFSGGEHIDIIN